MIQTKDERLIPFEPNGVQRLYLDQILPGWEEGIVEAKGLREIVLKARQFGFSTLIAALFFLRAVNNTDINVVIMADEADNTELLFAKVKLFWENLPPEKRPRTKYNSRRELYFPALRSRITVLTAGKKSAGRSRTIHCLHCSEVALWPAPSGEKQHLLTGLLQAVPEGGSVFLESTANGEAGDGKKFCEEYRAAKSGERSYNARFFAWWTHAEYEADPGPGFARDKDEITLVNKCDLDRRFGVERANRKLAWRRRKIAEPGMGTLFAQEYPSDDEEAFLVSGTHFFNMWSEKRHVVTPSGIVVEAWFEWIGGYDWGEGKPACFELGVVDDWGRVRTVDEVYGAGRTDPVQAADVVACLERWGLKRDRVPIYADPSMWANKKDNLGRVFQNVSAFFDAGLWFIQASNERIAGWTNYKRYLSEDGGPPDDRQPMFQASTRCQNLIRTMPQMIRDKDKPEDMESDSNLVEDHPPDTARYMLQSRPLADKPKVDVNAGLPAEIRAALAEQNQRDRSSYL